MGDATMPDRIDSSASSSVVGWFKSSTQTAHCSQSLSASEALREYNYAFYRTAGRCFDDPRQSVGR